jgi:hypothetical protein
MQSKLQKLETRLASLNIADSSVQSSFNSPSVRVDATTPESEWNDAPRKARSSYDIAFETPLVKKQNSKHPSLCGQINPELSDTNTTAASLSDIFDSCISPGVGHYTGLASPPAFVEAEEISLGVVVASDAGSQCIYFDTKKSDTIQTLKFLISDALGFLPRRQKLFSMRRDDDCITACLTDDQEASSRTGLDLLATDLKNMLPPSRIPARAFTKGLGRRWQQTELDESETIVGCGLTHLSLVKLVVPAASYLG